MKQQDVFNKIGGIIKELNDQYKYLADNPEDMNSLEMELFVANAHFLADHAEILNKISVQSIVTREAAKKEAVSREEKYFEPVVRQPEVQTDNKVFELESTDPAPHIDLTTSVPEDAYAITREEPEMIRHELGVDAIPDWDEEEEEIPVDEAPEEETQTQEAIAIPEEPVKPAFVAEEPVKPVVAEEQPAAKPADDKEEVLTINQKMSSQLSGKSSGLTEQAGTQAIDDLKQAISLNDKLLYIKDLFNGYSLAYSEAIEILNRFKTFDEAERFLNKNYVAKNNWESKADTTEKFYSILKRKYL